MCVSFNYHKVPMDNIILFALLRKCRKASIKYAVHAHPSLHRLTLPHTTSAQSEREFE